MRRAALGLLSVLTGCAAVPHPVGRDYAQGALAQFGLNRTSVADAEAVLGPPMRQTSMRSIAKPTATAVPPGSVITLTTLNYYYAPNGFGQPRGAHPAKSATLVFFQDRLAGYDLSNGIPGEVMPPVDEARLTALQQGHTTRDEAVALLGPPTGEVMHILDPQRGSREVAYGWAHRDGGTVELRTLRITFDTAGVLSSYTVVNNSFPVNGAPLLLLGPQAAPSIPPVPPMPRAIPHPDLEHT